MRADPIVGYVILPRVGEGQVLWRMGIVKTAVSVPEGIFERAEALARTMKTSRSRLYALALEDYLRRYDERQLVEQINAACDEEAPEARQRLLAGQRRIHRRVVEGEW